MAHTWSNELEAPYTAGFHPYSLLNERRASKFDDDVEDDDDDCFDDELEESERNHRSSTDASLSCEDAAGLIRYYFYESAQVLSHPVLFFRRMPVKGGLAEPSLFLLLSTGIYSLIDAFAHMDLFELFRSFFANNIVVFGGAFLASLIFRPGIAGKGNFESTFRVFAYSKATLLFAWIGVGSLQIGGWAAFAYTIVMNAIGLARVQKLPMPIVAAVAVVVAILQAAIARTMTL